MAIDKINHGFSKGPFCSYVSPVKVLLGYPLRGRTEVAYEEDEDVGDAMVASSRPFVFLFSGPSKNESKGL